MTDRMLALTYLWGRRETLKLMGTMRFLEKISGAESRFEFDLEDLGRKLRL